MMVSLLAHLADSGIAAQAATQSIADFPEMVICHSAWCEVRLSSPTAFAVPGCGVVFMIECWRPAVELLKRTHELF
jgi:hypothetical protein